MELSLDLGDVADVASWAAGCDVDESPALTGSPLRGSFGSLKKEVVESWLWLGYFL